MFTYLILRRGPFRSGKLRVLSACIPAVWSPLNGVTLSGHPAALAASAVPNHNPRWNWCTGANCGLVSASGNGGSSCTTGASTLPGATENVSMLKRPTKCPRPSPSLLVFMSPWYQETPNGVSGCWMTNKSNSVFLGMWRRVTFITSTGPKDLMVTLAWALGLRQSASTAALERTILKEVLSTAKAAAANKAPISSAAPTASNARLNLLFLLTFFSSLSSPQVLLVVSLDPSLCASLYTPSSCPLWACLQQTVGQYIGWRSWLHPSMSWFCKLRAKRSANFLELRNAEVQLRRIPIPRTPVNKGEKRGRSANSDLGLHNFNELPRPIIIVTPPAALGFRAYYSLPKARGLHERARARTGYRRPSVGTSSSSSVRKSPQPKRY